MSQSQEQKPKETAKETANQDNRELLDEELDLVSGGDQPPPGQIGMHPGQGGPLNAPPGTGG
jgi:hypothetical protein